MSLLIITKLPFPISDPVSDYEHRQYPNLRDYINAEIIPEMQKKLPDTVFSCAAHLLTIAAEAP